MPNPCEILPGILTTTAADFKARLTHPGLRKVAKTFHVDILDGTLFGANCWADAKTVGNWTQLPDVEIHCMVSDPLKHAQDWYAHVPSLKRVILHQNLCRHLSQTIATIKKYQLEIALAINPEETIDDLETTNLDALMLMGVHPGHSGQAFLGEPILAKLRRAHSLYPGLELALDGGVTKANLSAIHQAGATRCVATSAIWNELDPVEAYEELRAKCT